MVLVINMEMLQLKYFYESAQSGSFAKTAEKYMVPTSSVSASVKRLENELGCSLFDRQSNKITLNPNGERLKNSLKTVFAELEDAVGSITSNDETIGEIKMLVRSVRKEITKHIIEYKSTNPRVSFRTVFDFDKTDFEEYDIIIDEKSNAYPGYESFPLCTRTLRLKAKKGKFPKNHSMILGELKDESFVSFGDMSNTHRILVNACERAGFVPNIAVQTNDINCHETFISSGIGIGIGLESDNPSPDPDMEILDVKDFNERYDIFCYCKKSSRYGNVKKFLEFLSQKSSL